MIKLGSVELQIIEFKNLIWLIFLCNELSDVKEFGSAELDNSEEGSGKSLLWDFKFAYLKLTSQGILHYLGLADLSKSFSQYFFQ